MDQIKIDALDALSLVGLALLTLAMWIWGGWVLGCEGSLPPPPLTMMVLPSGPECAPLAPPVRLGGCRSNSQPPQPTSSARESAKVIEVLRIAAI